MPIEIKTKVPVKDLMAGLRTLTKSEVLVGVPAENAGREAEDGQRPLNNAEIGYIQEHGSTIDGGDGNSYVIPPRPHLRPGIEAAREKIAGQMKKGLLGAMKGDASAADKALHASGLVAQNAVRNKITEGPFVPLAPMTLQKRKARGRMGEKPLIDTGSYRSSISYVVRGKNEE